MKIETEKIKFNFSFPTIIFAIPTAIIGHSIHGSFWWTIFDLVFWPIFIRLIFTPTKSSSMSYHFRLGDDSSVAGMEIDQASVNWSTRVIGLHDRASASQTVLA